MIDTKKSLTLMDALLVLFLYFKLSGTGPKISWFEVFLPLIVGFAADIILLLFKTSWRYQQIKMKVELWLWKRKLRQSMADAALKAQNEILEAYKKGAKSQNPGKAHEQHKTGKL